MIWYMYKLQNDYCNKVGVISKNYNSVNLFELWFLCKALTELIR